MPMPPQLARARRPKRYQPRPLVEQLQKINVNHLAHAFPFNWFDWHSRGGDFRWTFIKAIRLCRRQAEFTLYSQRSTVFGIKWIKTGLGKPRPAFICKCKRSVITLYFNHGNLACRRCSNAIYAAQVLDKKARPILQAIRLRRFFNSQANIGTPFPAKRKTTMRYSTYYRLKGRCMALERNAARPRGFRSKRVNEYAMRPQSNYQTRGPANWR